MNLRPKTSRRPRPLVSSLTTFRNLLGIAAALGFASQSTSDAATSEWQGVAGATPGDGQLWLDPLNWQNDSLPLAVDDLVFGTGIPGVIDLGSDQTANSLAFTENFTLGAYGSSLVLTNTSGNVAVSSGKFATMNASYGGNAGINLSGGGSLFLNHPLPRFGGDISVSGAGSTIVHRGEGVYPQYNGANSAQEFGRTDQLTLGFTTATRAITLSNGGTYKLIGSGNNSEGGTKNIVIGSGGGTVNLAAGYLQLNLDDTGQLVNAVGNTLTKTGAGRLNITGNLADANTLAGNIIVNGGIFEFGRLQGNSTTANTRFSGLTGTTAGTPGSNSVTVNANGVLFLNNGTVGNFDAATVTANDGAILAINSQDHEFGVRTQGNGTVPANVLEINGTVNILARDLFGVQTQRAPRINSALTGSGTLQVHPSTNAGSTPRVVIQRGVGSTFTGTFRMLENASVEANPRANGPVVDVGNVLGFGDIEFAGWGGTLDVRDSTATASVLDYTSNEVSITTTQNGAVNAISVIRAGTAAGTGNLFNFGTLTIGDHRLGITGNNSYQVGFADTASVVGNAAIEMRADGVPLVFSNAAAFSEDAAGRSLTFVKIGAQNAGARDVISGGAISLSNLEVQFGTLQLRGASGRIAPGFGGAAPLVVVNGGGVAGATRDMPTGGVLHLDNNTGHVVGGTTVFAAANAGDRVDDSAAVVMRGNSIMRLTSASGAQSTETIGAVTVGGHSLFDVVKNGTAPQPVALTLNSLTLASGATANFAGTGLGTTGTNTSRIVIPGTATGVMGAEYHVGNEWAKYDGTVDSGFAIGVTPFVASDYTINSTQDTWATGQQIKNNAAASTIALTGNRAIARYNSQMTGTTTTTTGVNVSGFVLTLEQGGLLNSGITTGIFDSATTPSAGGLTAGTTAPAALYVYSNNQLDIRVPVRDNLGVNGVIGGGDDNAVDFVKTGPGTVRLTHQSLGVGAGTSGISPFTAATWTSTLTGSWIINDGTLNVHRGQFLNGRPIVMNGGVLEINHPVPTSSANSILPLWGNDVTVNGNAMIGMDDNGESADANVGGNTIALMGSLVMNNGSTLGQGSFNGLDIAFMGGATFNGRGTINIGPNRSGANGNLIISGALTGDGFDLVNYVGAPQTMVLGGTVSDTAANTFDGAVRLYGGTLRLNKANGTVAIPNGSDAEDLIINGGTLAWGAGHHGDLATTNNITLTNNGVVGIVPLSPTAVKNAGMNQIADTATITLLSGTLGEADRIANEKWGVLNQKNGTFNVGLGSIEVDVANFSGGAFGIDRGGAFKAGTLNLQPGSPDLNITTGIPAPGGQTVLEVGAGGVNFTGQSVILGTGSSGNLAGSGAVMRLGGNVNVTGTQLLGGSFSRRGIFVQLGNSFREIGNSRLDLMGGNRVFDISEDALFTITAPITNGGLVKEGAGGLVLEAYIPSDFAGPVTVNEGTLWARSKGAFGTSAGGVTVNSGGSVKLEGGWDYTEAFTLNGRGAHVAGDVNVREPGALIAETGTSRIAGPVVVQTSTTIAANTVTDPSAAPAASGAAYRIANLLIDTAGGITGNGNLSLSGHGDGTIANGVNLASGDLYKDGAGRWTLSGASSFSGETTVAAGALRVTHALALGGLGGTTVRGGSLELAGGIALAENLSITGPGASSQSGALVNVSGSNSITSTVAVVGSTTLRSDGGNLLLSNTAALSGDVADLTLSGSGTGTVGGSINFAGASLTKQGSGTWTLAGNNSFNGTTSVRGGTLLLDFTANNGSKIDSASELNLSGGTLSLVGNALSATSQIVSATNISGGGNQISVTSGGAQTAALVLGLLNRTNNATVNFSLPSSGAILTSSTAANGILGSYATVGEDWAALSGSSITPYAGYTPFASAGAADNAILADATQATGPVVANTLKIGAQAGGLASNFDISLAGGGLIYSGAQPAGIAGTGILSTGNPNDELVIHTSDAAGVLTIATPLIGAGSGSLTKAGPGTVILRGTSSFTGSVQVNGGTLIVPGAPAFPGVLGGSVAAGNRLVNLNGGAMATLADWDLNDWDAGAAGVQSFQFNVGSGGGTLKALYSSNLTLNDGSATAGVPTQLMGDGRLTFAGGGRYTLSGGTPQFQGFTGEVVVDGGILTLGHSFSLGVRQEQTITLKAGSTIINNAALGVGQNGVPNNIIAEGGVEFFALGGNRVFGGDIRLTGTNNVMLFERDTLNQERQVYFNGRVSGSGVTLNVFGANNGNPFYLTSGANDITGEINLGANAVLEARMPGSLGLSAGDVTVNLNGANSRVFLRHYQNANYRANVEVNATSEINADRLAGIAGGASQLLSINDLAVNTNGILTVNGANGYGVQVSGTATMNANAAINTTGGNLILDNGLSFAGGADTLDKRGGASIVLRGPSTHTGDTILQQGLTVLIDGGTLPSTSGILLRGGELRVDNGAVSNSDRLNDAAPISLGGGVLRITGAETLGAVTASSGTTSVIYNPTSETVASALTLTSFTRNVGSVVQFQSPDLGPGAVGQSSLTSARVSSRILIPGQANTTQTIPGLVGNNGLDFVQYDGTTIDNGAPLGVRDMRNPTSTISPSNYSNDPGEGAWTDAIIARLTNATDNTTVTTTLSASRALDAIKVETGGTNRIRTIELGANQLRIEGAGILDVSATGHVLNINGTGTLTAGPAAPGAGTAELFLGGTGVITIAANVGNNGAQSVALVKTGTGTVNLTNAVGNTYSGGTYVTAGTLNTTVPGAFGLASNPINLAGGTLLFNIPNALTIGDLGVPDHPVNVLANSTIVLDNGSLAGTDNDITLGPITINGPYTLGLRSFDSMDAAFTGTHTLAGTPTFDMAQAGSGGNKTGIFALGGEITGSGFYVTSSGDTNDTTSILQIGDGEAIDNTYNGKVTVLLANRSEDLELRLNKAPGSKAIAGDLEINGGVVRNAAADQISDASNLFINQGQYDANGMNERIASVTMRGGNFRTSSGATGNNTVTVTGDFEITGSDDLTGSADGVAANSNSTLVVEGILKINGYGRGTVGGTASTMVLGGLQMTGTTLLENGGGSLIRLNGDVTTFASSNVARLGATTAAGAQVQLNGTRTFTTADGTSGIDLSISTALTNSTSPVAVGAFVKAGAGTAQLEGAGLANTYTGGTTVNEGELVLFKSVGVNAIPAGALTIGDGVGGVRADRVTVRNSNQIADAATVGIQSSGVLDLSTFNTSETIGALSGSGNVDLGPGSVLTVSGSTDTTFSGSIVGAGSVVKGGASILELTGVNAIAAGLTVNGGEIVLNGSLSGSVTANTGGTLSGDGSIIGPVAINAGATLSPGNSPGTLDVGSLSIAGTLLAEFDSTSSYDQLNVTGTVSLSGSLNLSIGAGPFAVFDVFGLILNDGVDSVTGSFAGLPEGALVGTSGGFEFFISYEGNVDGGPVPNDVVLVVPEPGSAALLLGGLGSLLAMRRRRRNA